jgi:hypothetical protein
MTQGRTARDGGSPVAARFARPNDLIFSRSLVTGMSGTHPGKRPRKRAVNQKQRKPEGAEDTRRPTSQERTLFPMQNQSTCSPQTPATPAPLPTLADAILAVMSSLETPANIHDGLGDILDEAFRKAGIDDIRRPDLLRFKLGLLLGDSPTITAPAANQAPTLDDVHKRCFEMHVRTLVRTFDTTEEDFDTLYQSIVDPENNDSGSSASDLALDFRDLKRAVYQFAVLFGIDPSNAYDMPDFIGHC